MTLTAEELAAAIVQKFGALIATGSKGQHTTPDDEDELWTTPQTAKYLRVQPQTLESWRIRGTQNLPFIKVGRRIRYRRSDIDRWLRARSQRG